MSLTPPKRDSIELQLSPRVSKRTLRLDETAAEGTEDDNNLLESSLDSVANTVPNNVKKQASFSVLPPETEAQASTRRKSSFSQHYRDSSFSSSSHRARQDDAFEQDHNWRNSREGSDVGEEDDGDEHLMEDGEIRLDLANRKAKLVRGFALAVACLLSIGAHYGREELGPLKSRLHRELGTSNSQFSLMVASMSLNSTWTPLVAGLITARLGTAVTSIIATSLILAGQLILLFSTASSSIPGMSFGLMVFGLGLSPVAVVQETIVVRYFSNHGLGISLALGLVAGKGASFLSSILSEPISKTFGTTAPFVVSSLLAGVSFTVNIFYLVLRNHLTPPAPPPTVSSYPSSRAESTLKLHENDTEDYDLDADALRKVSEKKMVRLRDLIKLGDIFWLYIFINVISGMIWSPFMALASNLIQRRYQLSESRAAAEASILLAGAIFLYPIAGFISDRYKGRIAYKLFLGSSTMTLVCFAWLRLPVGLTRSALPAMIFFGIGQGASPLLLVIIVPQLVKLRYVSTALGAHKSMEMAGSTFFTTLAGLILDKKEAAHPHPVIPSGNTNSTIIGNSTSIILPRAPPVLLPTNDTWIEVPADTPAVHFLLSTFFLMNVIQWCGIALIYYLAIQKQREARPDATHADDEQYGALHDQFVIDDNDEEQEDDRDGEAQHNDRDSEANFKMPPINASPVTSAPQSNISDSSDAALLRHHRSTTSLVSKSTLGAERDSFEQQKAEKRRGRMAFGVSIGFVVVVWIFFVITTVRKLHSKT